MSKRKDWIKKKDMTPEERKAFDHYESAFSNRYFKQHTILFFVWLVGVIIGYVLEFTGHWNIFASILHLLWTLAGLVATLVFDHYAKSYAQEHIHDPIPPKDPVDIQLIVDNRTPDQTEPAATEEAPEETASETDAEATATAEAPMETPAEDTEEK